MRLASHFYGGDVLLVLPPFSGIERPSLGLHVLKAVAEERGFKVDIFNANVDFARVFGEDAYTKVCYAPTGDLSGEEVFSSLAFNNLDELNADEHGGVEQDWINDTARGLAESDYPVIGFNTMFEQLTCSLALIRQIKKINPDKILIIGGAQCEGEMGEGILALDLGVDYVFSGESEHTFVSFLKVIEEGSKPNQRLICGQPLHDLENLPFVDYSSYFDQFNELLPNSEISRGGLHWLPLEGSRGCWWGQKHHCTFCGINGGGMTYRMKSGPRILSELTEKFHEHQCRNILMVDNIMPHQYFDTFLPDLAQENLDLRIFYEQKANITFEKMGKLKSAGVNMIQPGIESLSDELLSIMKKGVRSWQNIASLRFARMHDIYVNWNMLHSFPGDDKDHYRKIERLIPLLHHLCPPSGLNRLAIDRFSPYFDNPTDYGVQNIRPMESYYNIFPKGAPVEKLAYHFEADFSGYAINTPCALDHLDNLLSAWISSWEDQSAPPILALTEIDDENFLLLDTRQVSERTCRFVSLEVAKAALFGAHYDPGPEHDWCVDHGFCVEIGDVVVPLATTKPQTYRKLSDRSSESYQQELIDPVPTTRPDRQKFA